MSAATARSRRTWDGYGARWSSCGEARLPTRRSAAHWPSPAHAHLLSGPAARAELEHQRRAVVAQPASKSAVFGTVLREQCPEPGRVIHHLEVTDLVPDHVVEHRLRGQ